MKYQSPKRLAFGLLSLVVISALWFSLSPVSAQKQDSIESINESIAAPAFEIADNLQTIYLNAESINTRSERGAELRNADLKFGGKRLHLVKFKDAIQPEWIADLKANGAEIVDYIPNFAYLIYADAASLTAIRADAMRDASPIEWDGAFASELKIQPAVFVRGKSKERILASNSFTVQLFRDAAANAETLNLLESLKKSESLSRFEISNYVNITVALDENGIRQTAARSDVISIYPYVEPEMLDERQTRIVTGQVSGNVPTAGNHLTYLAGKGFTQAQFDASNFSVNVVDSGIDSGGTGGVPNTTSHFALFRQGDPTTTSRVVFARPYGTATDADTAGCFGHGALDAHILGGFVPDGAPFNAAPHADGSGYRYGEGVAPFVKVGSSVIFKPSGAFSLTSNAEIINLESEAYNSGSRISTNSWGSAVKGLYNAEAQLYDFLVRDAQQPGSSFPVAGNQEYAILFAAGNSGSTAQTVYSSGTAKNVITVGASENVHPFGANDGCGISDTIANSLNDVASFSSRGPTIDNRKKPEIMAPGTHITGGVEQQTLVAPVSGTGDDASCFTGAGICGLGAYPNKFFPSGGQQWYTAGSGTSQAAPAAAGGAALIRQHFLNQGLSAPSPAMTKVVLMSSAAYMNGAGANDALWSNNQGMGLMNLDTAFDSIASASKIIRDQAGADKFTATNQSRVFNGTIAAGANPTRITLAWTDAPGSTAGNAYVNNLDLEITINGQLYRGNVFAGANSVSGGTADARNNAESIFFPAGTFASGTAFSIRVKATNIAGNGVPNDADPLDQDFALLASNVNAAGAGVAVLDNQNISIVSESLTPPNSTPDAGEAVTVSFDLRNVGGASSAATTVTLQNSGFIASPSAAQSYGSLTAGGASVSRNFSFNVPTTLACAGGSIVLSFLVQEASNNFTITKVYTLGTSQQIFAQNFDGVTAPALPAGWVSSVESSGTGWTTATSFAASAPNSAFAGNPTMTGVSNLESPAIAINSGTARLEFNIRYDTEDEYDGTNLEIKIGGGAYTDIIAAGATFNYGYFTDHLFGSAIGNRLAWSGNSSGFVPVSINLPTSANGQNVQFRWRMVSDAAVGGVGFWLDDVKVFGANTCLAGQGAVLETSQGAGWYAGDGDARDHIGANDGTEINGAAYAVGKVGQAFSLDGMNDYVQIPDNAALDVSGSLTIEAWIRPTAVGNNRIADKITVGGSDGYLLDIAGGNLRMVAGSRATTSSTAIVPNVWQHVAGVYDTATGQITLYVNGAAFANPFAAGALPTNSLPLRIGADQLGGTLFQGLIDETTIHSRVLTAAEITAIYNAGINGKVKQDDISTGVSQIANVGDQTLTFANITADGRADSITLDTATLTPALPDGFTHTGLAYEIGTTAAFTGNVETCFKLTAFNNPTVFAKLRVMHVEGGVWVNKTISNTFATRTVCGQVNSLSPFAIADATPTSAAAALSGRVITTSGRGLHNLRLTLTDSNGAMRTAHTNPFGYYRFAAVPTGENYTLEVNSKRWQFPTQFVQVMGETENVDFIAKE